MSNFATLDSLKKKEGEDGEQQELYAGGPQGGSGLNVVGPGAPRDAHGQDGEMSTVEKVLTRAAAEGATEREEEVQGTHVVLTLWRNGFTIGENPTELRPFGEEANDEFIHTISNGKCPKELMVDGKVPLIKLENKRDEDFVPPKYVAFSGTSVQVGQGAAKGDSSVITPSQAKTEPLLLDDGEDKVRVQVVYASTRERHVVNFNKRHTVRDLISVIDSSGNVNAPYQMLHSVRGPPKPIDSTEFDKTITDAGLAGAAVTIKLI